MSWVTDNLENALNTWKNKLAEIPRRRQGRNCPNDSVCSKQGDSHIQSFTGK